jgi:calcium binding protein 39
MVFAAEACKQQLPEKMADFLGELDFESRKTVVQIFSTVMRIQIGASYPGLVYIREHPRLLDVLFEGYSDPQVALNYGAMIRECLRHEEIAEDFLRSPLFKELIIKLEVDEFDVASDAFLTFKDVLTRHKPVVATYLTENYSEFVGCYRALLESQNYVTRRQSVKLLGELLLDRENVKAMMRYVSEVDNLVLMMNLLKDSSKSIQFEAFHVFKVFVANPKKTPAIAEVLYKNKDKLLRYLADFHNDRDDKLFKEEKDVIIREIEDLRPPA